MNGETRVRNYDVIPDRLQRQGTPILSASDLSFATHEAFTTDKPNLEVSQIITEYIDADCSQRYGVLVRVDWISSPKNRLTLAASKIPFLLNRPPLHWWPEDLSGPG